MKSDPQTYHRNSLRLKSYDYSQSGGYFVTICTRNREWYFEQYPELRTIVEHGWKNIQNRYSNIELDEFIIMPNHLHGIIIIGDKSSVGATLAIAKNSDAKTKSVGATLAVAQHNRAGAFDNRAGASPAPTLGDIIGSFKSLCANNWLKFINKNNINAPAKIWQRNYYEHIIRNEKELERIRQYIINNSLQWEFDRENHLSDTYNISYKRYFRGIYDS